MYALLLIARELWLFLNQGAGVSPESVTAEIPFVRKLLSTTLQPVHVPACAARNQTPPSECTCPQISRGSFYLSDKSIVTERYPPYSPDLAPCEFWLYSYIKYTRGRRFESHHAVCSALFQCLNTIPKESFRRAFSEWIRQLEKCIRVRG